MIIETITPITPPTTILLDANDDDDESPDPNSQYIQVAL